MSAGATTSAPRAVARPGARTRFAAVLVVIALAALALYAVFAPPTTVPLGPSPQHAAPVKTVPATPGGEPEEERGGEGGD